LGAGVPAFPPHDDPHPFWPAGQIEHAGQFGDLRTVTHAAVGVRNVADGSRRREPSAQRRTTAAAGPTYHG
jgi:hypothetical protein